MTTRRGPSRIEVEIEELGADGMGRGWYGERSLVARNALPGEQVAVRVLKRRHGTWYGEAEVPATAAATRRAPACGYFPRCGGCAMQHVDHAAQLEIKMAHLRAQLAEHSVVPRRLRPPTTGPLYHYRHKARLGVRLVDGEVLAGFREGFGNRVVRMRDCKTLAEPFARMLPRLREALGGMSAPDRVPQVELAAGDRDFAVVVRHLTEPTRADREHWRRFEADTGMRVYLQPGGYDSVRPLDSECVRPLEAGRSPYLSYANADFGVHYEFLPTDFTQVNPFINRALVRAVALALAPRPGSQTTETFCGIGNFSLALARTGTRVRGFEAAHGAVERARHNADRNGLGGQAEFAVADLYDSRCPDLPESDYLVLDPPRPGAGLNLERWAAAPRLEKIAYVSCNPRTFAGDAARLGRQGFALQEVGIFEMFPHTAHVETMGLFVRDRLVAAGG